MAEPLKLVIGQAFKKQMLRRALYQNISLYFEIGHRISQRESIDEQTIFIDGALEVKLTDVINTGVGMNCDLFNHFYGTSRDTFYQLHEAPAFKVIYDCIKMGTDQTGPEGTAPERRFEALKAVFTYCSQFATVGELNKRLLEKYRKKRAKRLARALKERDKYYC